MPTILNRFLVEHDTGFPGKDEASLRLFTDKELRAWLGKNIEHAHYGGDDEFQLHGIYRYDAPGKLTELVLTCASQNVEPDDDDDLHYDYEVWEPGEQRKVELTLTVRIDGRA